MSASPASPVEVEGVPPGQVVVRAGELAALRSEIAALRTLVVERLPAASAGEDPGQSGPTSPA